MRSEEKQDFVKTAIDRWRSARDKRDSANILIANAKLQEAEATTAIIQAVQMGRLPTRCLTVKWREVIRHEEKKESGKIPKPGPVIYNR